MLWTRDKGLSLGWIITNSITNSLQAKNGCLFKMRMTNNSNIQLTAQFRHHWHLPDISNKLSVENLLSNFQQFQILTATMTTVLVSRLIWSKLNWSCFQHLSSFSFILQLLQLGRVSNNQNGNLRWFLQLGVDPPRFLPHFFYFAIESYIYETDFTLQKYHF